MSDITTHLLLPYILAAQAQKHVTHNEALRLLDAMVQLSVLDRDLTAPPASPADGDRYIVASGATGLWAGWDLNVTTWVDGVWMRLVPRPGWLAWIADEATFFVWNGSAWQSVGVPQDVSDAIFSLVNDVDPTKRALFSLSGISTATTRTFTLPNTSSELTILAGTQTFNGNKTFSGSLTASGTVTVSSAAATIGTSVATSTYGMGTGATTTGVTKTVNLGTGGASGSNTVVNIGSATPGAGGTTVVNTPTVTFANAVTAVGMPQATVAQTLRRGITYWIGIRHSSTAILSAWASTATPDLNGGALVTTARKVLRRTLAYATAAPGAWGYLSSETNAGPGSAIWLRAA